MRLQSLVLASAFALAATPAAAAPFTALYVFGDSLSDNGNLAAIAAGAGLDISQPPYAPGRASNGKVAVEVLAKRLGLPLLPFAAGGTNFAVIGAATGEVVNPGGMPPMVDNISEQLLGASLPVDTGIGYQVAGAIFLAGGVLDPNALYVVWGGANDISINPSPLVATQAADNIGASVAALYGRGARNFLVPNLPDLGATPGAAGPLAPAITGLALNYNSRLAGHLARLGAQPGANIVAFDTFSALQNLGPRFANTTQPCVIGNVLFSQYAPYCGPGVEDEFLFWDTSHPTGRAHKLLGQQFARAVGVPEPASLLLGALGLAGVAYRRRRAA